ncbi:hypothetical protein [Sphingomonas aerolata]|uniref:hypothetical protein n=1 Tax=Sphingomonas aerolata TaxID=185951 RepID=UPI00141A9A7B|nr:hypothetical protein [Sphingomonas aerolata]NII60015.1 hypothetical protein [Sphingomonas aerolata]
MKALTKVTPFVRRIELRWFASVTALFIVWFALFKILAMITYHSKGLLQCCLLTLLCGFLALISTKFGARFKALNERSKLRSELLWAMLFGVGSPALISALTLERVKAILHDDVSRIGLAPSVALLVWVVTYGWVLKLPWDRLTDLEKPRHKRRKTSLMIKAARARRSHRASEARLVAEEVRLVNERRDTLARWSKLYPDWKMTPAQKYFFYGPSNN